MHTRSVRPLPCVSILQLVHTIPSIVSRWHAVGIRSFLFFRYRPSLVWVQLLSQCIIHLGNRPFTNLDWIRNTQHFTCVFHPELRSTHCQRSVQQQKNDKSQSCILLFRCFIRCMSNKLPKPPPTLSERQAAQAPLARAEHKFGELKYCFWGA